MKSKSIHEQASDDEKPGERSGVQVIARAAAILRTLKDAPEGLSLGDIAKLLSLPRSTIQRIVEALDQENFVIAASPTRGVRLGPALLALGTAARFEIAEIARQTLQLIASECGETVDLSLLDGNKLVFVDQIPGTHRLRVESAIGVSFPLHSTAPGKAMLAKLPPEALNKLRLRLRLTPLTSHTITSWNGLEGEIAKAQDSGVAFDIEENSLGICATAVALALPNGEFAAVSVPVPAQRFTELRPQLVELLMTHCAKLQQNLTGGRFR